MVRISPKDLLATWIMTVAAAAALVQAQPAREDAATGEAHAEVSQDLIDSIKKPTDWLEWGFDLRLRETYIGNAFTLSKHDPDHEWHWQRQRARVWATATPTDDISIDLRLAWEGKHFDRPLSRENWLPTSLLFDRFNIRYSNVLGLPLTIQAGRQDLMFGDGWLVMDGTPLDGSSTVFFDAVRFTVDLEDIDTSIDLIYFEQDAEEDGWFCPLVDENRFLIEQDETGAIIWVSNKSLSKTQIDGFAIYKRSRPVLAGGDQGEIYTVGLRLQHKFTDQLSLTTNVAGQFGRRNGNPVCAMGRMARLRYAMRDEWKSSVWVDYEYLSGDRPGTGRDEAFDILWGRWPRFSELYLYHKAGETRIGQYTNLHRVGAGWSAHPTDRMELRAGYHLLFRDHNTYRDRSGFSDGGCFRGQLATGRVIYKFSRQLSGHLTGEVFCPGGYYSDERNDTALFLRAELVFSF